MPADWQPVADSVPRVDTSANFVEVRALPYLAVERYLAILVFLLK